MLKRFEEYVKDALSKKLELEKDLWFNQVRTKCALN